MEDTYEGWGDDYTKGFYYEPSAEEDAAWEEENSDEE